MLIMGAITRAICRLLQNSTVIHARVKIPNSCNPKSLASKTLVRKFMPLTRAWSDNAQASRRKRVRCVSAGNVATRSCMTVANFFVLDIAAQPGFTPAASELLSDSLEHCRNRSQQDFQVHGRTPVLDVLQVQSNILFKGRIAACFYLPQAGNSGGYVEPAQVLQTVLINFVFDGRSRPHQAHIAFQHIPKLRQFVEAVLTQDATNARDARVVRNLEERSLPFIHCPQTGPELICIIHHGAELVEGETSPLLTDPVRAVQSRTAGVQIDGNRYRQ